MSAIFHLNKQAKRELTINFNDETLPYELGATLDRSLTCHDTRSWHHASLSWGGLLARATTYRTVILTLVHSTPEWAPAWPRSAHTRLIDPIINDALRTVIRFPRPAPADKLPLLAGNQPAELRRKGATLPLARRGSNDPLLHQARNQLGTPGGSKSFLRGPNFWNHVQHIFPEGGENFFRGGFGPPASP